MRDFRKEGNCVKIERTELIAGDGRRLPGRIFLPDGEKTCVVQITHGMTEHIGRYADLALALTDAGAVAAGFDLRGHGENAPGNDIASFGEGGWEASLTDMKLFSDFLKERYPSLPRYMLGFSLGSFLLREYLGVYDDGLSGAVIMGTGHQPNFVLAVMKAIIKGQISKNGFDNTTALIESLSFGAYNRAFRPNRTESDWLIADEKALQEYLTDPLCKKSISSGLFYDLVSAMKRTGAKDAYDGWNKKLPVLLLSGQEDPVGSGGKGVKAVYSAMKKAGFENVGMRLIPGARHIVLSEKASGAKDECIKAVCDFVGGKQKDVFRNDFR